ncbi:MAG: hypothetical protein GW818_06670 [Flavobacteriales bacterium]|nr:hypothetical protein [Flavobacteriales bacterium]
MIRFLVIFIVYFLSQSSFTLFAQEEEESKKGVFFGGVSIGSFFANSNTAVIYTGGSNITPYGINYILTLPQNKTTFDAYFKYPYWVEELPQEPAYNTAFDIGLHLGVYLSKLNSIYLDLNITEINYEQTFTMAIDNPLNMSPEPTYEQIPIIGKEKRFNLNLGTQLSFYSQEKVALYWSFFGNINSVKLERNYIVINNREYEIFHNTQGEFNRKPGGVGYGGGTGLGFKYQLTEKITTDFTYNLFYTKVNMNENIQSFGLQHGLVLRIIWS